jgi:peptide/nickel transport system substrate-binding protein
MTMRSMRILLLVTLVGLLASCGAPTSTQPASEPTAPGAADPVAAGPQSGGEVIWADYEPNTLNPYIASEAIARSVIALVNRGLVGISADGEFFPVFVTELPSEANGGVSADGKVITWRLKPDLTWSDGTPFTSDDIKFTWEAVAHPTSGATQTQGFDLIERIDTPDPQTAVVHYREFWGPWMTQFALGILPRHNTGDPAQMSEWEWNRTANPTNGPFTLQEWAAASQMIFVRNDNWHEPGKPYLDRILYPITTNLEVQRQMLRSGQNHLHHWLADDYVDEVGTWSNVEVVQSPGPYWYRVQFNLSERGDARPAPPAQPHPILGDVNVRRAIGMAINREQMVSHWKGIEFMESMFRGEFECNLPEPVYDQEQSQAMLEAAGWTDSDGDGVRECNGCTTAEAGTPMRLEISSYTGWNREDEQVVLVENLKAVGIDAYIQNHEPTVLYGTWGEGSTARRGDFDILWWDYELGYDPQVKAEDFYASWRIPSEENPGTFNVTRVNDPEIDEWLRTAGSTSDTAIRKEAYCNIATKIAEEIVNEWVVGVGVQFSAVSTQVQGLEMNEAFVPYAIFGWDAENWYLVP